MDINLTGQIANDLVYNLKPTIWNSAILFGVMTGIITSTMTYFTVKQTNSAAEEREKRNRNAAEEREEQIAVKREERR